MFTAALVIIGDLVAVINTYLSGEITARFILKAFSILFVASLVFGYYLDDVRKGKPTNLAKPFAYGTSFLVVIAIIGSFFIIGSPKLARDLQFDQQRVNDLSNIQWQIVTYWQRKGQLPSALSDLHDSISGFSVPVDPETQQNYTYEVINTEALSFQLCATFDQPAEQQRNTKYVYPVASQDENWQHPKGYYCFERIIDKQLYPPIQAK